MARATTKAELMTSAQRQYDKMWLLIDGMSKELQEASFAAAMVTAGKETHWRRDKNLRDLLIHLYEWHQLLLEWERANTHGLTKPFLPEPYNWRTYPALNIAFWEKHQATSLAKAKEMLRESHAAVMALMEQYSDDQLFARGALEWAGSSTLGSYCVSVTASHYEWAMKKIKKHLKTSPSPQ